MKDLKRILFNFFKYLNKIWIKSQELSNITSYSCLLIFIDCLYCYLRYDCYIEWYFKHFYKLSRTIRANTLTHNKFKKIYKNHNQQKESNIFLNKVEFNKVFHSFQKHDSLYVKSSSFTSFSRFISKHNSFIVKPIDCMQGSGIYKYKLDVSEDVVRLYEKLSNDNVLIEEIITPHDKMVFNNTSLNTIRIYTILSSQHKVHIASAILRCGVGESLVDNYCAGGVLYNIDIDTGIISSKGFNSMGSYLYHPNCLVPMVGYQIPLWEQVIAYVKQLAHVVPQCKIIGWDIAISDKGIDVIEGNHDPNHELLEIFNTNGMYTKIIKMLS